MSQRDIAEQIKALYDVEISPELVSKISEKIMPEVTAWQNRPLDAVYPFVFLDAIHYKVKENHQYVTKAAYVVLGINTDGRKDILGIWIGQHESAKFWAGVLNDLKSRGVKDVYLFCVDGLNGFREAIAAAYPQAQIQRCIIHQIRSSTRYVSWKDIKALMADLKKVYQAVTEEEALSNLMAFKDAWGKQYPSCIKSWEENLILFATIQVHEGLGNRKMLTKRLKTVEVRLAYSVNTKIWRGFFRLTTAPEFYFTSPIIYSSTFIAMIGGYS